MEHVGSARMGALAALGAFLIWGVLSLYLKMVGELPALEILAHRILGGALFVAVLQGLKGSLGELAPLSRDYRALGGLAGSAVLIAINWGVFIWAVSEGRALEASLGYFIFPLVSVLLARVVLGERLSPRQWAAVGLCAGGVGWMAAWGQGLPWIALVLGLSFGGYGLLRKTIVVSSLTGLLVETVVLAPFAALYLVSADGGLAPQLGGKTLALIALAGPITAIPLALFAFAARRLRLSTLGLMMYVNPSVQMLVAVFVFAETFTRVHAVTFTAIWAGLLVYSWPRRPANA